MHPNFRITEVTETLGDGTTQTRYHVEQKHRFLWVEYWRVVSIEIGFGSDAEMKYTCKEHAVHALRKYLLEHGLGVQKKTVCQDYTLNLDPPGED